MPSRRTVVAAVVPGVTILALAIVLGIVLQPRGTQPLATPTPEPTYAGPAAAPVRNAAIRTPTPASVSIGDLVDPAWLAATSRATGIPSIPLSAYAGAAIRKAEQMPACGISWNTLAAIGWVESRDGSYGGATIAADGTISPPIYGVALDGVVTQQIPDSDKGKFDKDAEFDRAIGPMQMIPQSWRNWRTDASGDGKRDPQNMFDAVMAATNYLCRATRGTDMVSVSGWQQGIASYNSAPSYLHAVARRAIAYEEESR